MTVYKLDHLHIQQSKAHEADWKFIGIYSSREKSECAIRQLRTVKGFKDFPELITSDEIDEKSGFYIEEISIDNTNWQEGFSTYEYD